jgi:5'-nucleotidase
VVQILLVNDDGIHSPGLQAMADALAGWGHVTVVAPAIEQSGVGHTITYLHPLVVHREHRHGTFFGWKVEGSPADCTKLGILELSPQKPDLIISGINTGANVGINVIYSGTVAGAVEGAFFGIPSIAVSQFIDPPADYPRTARLAVDLCRQLVERSTPEHLLWNVNFPANRPGWPAGAKLSAMCVRRHTEFVEKRTDPRGRVYFWSGLNPLKSHHADPGTDIHDLQEGYVTITPLQFDLTSAKTIERLHEVNWRLPDDELRTK